jgi:hypothetical protein
MAPLLSDGHFKAMSSLDTINIIYIILSMLPVHLQINLATINDHVCIMCDQECLPTPLCRSVAFCDRPSSFWLCQNQPRRPHLEWWRQSLQCWCLRQHQNISHSIRPVPVPLVNDALTLNNMLTYVTVASSLVDSTFQYFHDLPWFIMSCCCSGLISLSPTVYRTECVLPTLDLGDRTQYNLSDALPGLVEDLAVTGTAINRRVATKWPKHYWKLDELDALRCT